MSGTTSDLEFGGRVTLEDGFSRVADTVSARFSRFRRDFGAGVLSMDGMLNRVRTNVSMLPGVVSRASGAMDRFLSPMAGMAMGAARFLAIPILRGIFSLGRAAVRSSSEMENLRIAMTRMLGGADIANEHLRELQQFAVGRPFEFRDLVTASANLQRYGFHVGEVRGLLQDFGDAAFISGRGIRGVNTMVRVFGSTLATQRITYGQLNQLVNAGIPAHEILREQLHLSGQQLRNIARSGIPAVEIIAALRRGMVQRFGGGMALAAQTITARLSDLHDVAGIFLSFVGDELRPTIMGFLNELGHGIVSADMNAWAKRTADGLATLARIVRIVLSPITGAFTDLGNRWKNDSGRAARPLFNFLRNIRDVVQGVEALLTGDKSGIGLVPSRLHNTLIRNGLWPLTLRIAQWGHRVRMIVGGFIEGVLKNFSRLGVGVTAIAAFFGIAHGRMTLTSAGARTLGSRLADLFAGVLALRVGLAALSLGIRLASAAQMAFNVVMSANPIGLIAAAILLVAVETYLLVRYWDQIVAAFEKHKRIIAVLALLTAPITFMIATMLAVPVAIAYVITHWDRLKKTFTGGMKEMQPAFDRWEGRIERVKSAVSLLADVFRVARAVIVTEAGIALDNAGDWLSDFFGMDQFYSGLGRLGGMISRALGHFDFLRKGVSAVAKGISSTVTDVFAGIGASVMQSIRRMVGDLVAVFHALPVGLRPAGLGGAIERLDAFALGGPQPGAQGALGSPTNMIPMGAPTAPTAPQLIVQRTAAQARTATAGAQGPAPVVHLTNTPAPTIVQIDGREVARTVARHQADEHMRGGGAGSDDT